MENLNSEKSNGLPDEKETATGAKTAGNKNVRDTIAFFFGESQVAGAVLTQTNWWPVSLILGFITALIHLILIGNPGIGYLLARNQVRGFEVTLPEAMAAVETWGWFNLILYPLQLSVGLAATAWLMCRIMRFIKGTGHFRSYFGLVTGSVLIFTLGQFTGYLIVHAQDLKHLSDLRDLTPGVGLGLLPLFAVERTGPFWREVVRGFDLFGIWLILFMTGALKGLEGFSKVKSFGLVFWYYGLFIALRWLFEGPANRLWHYFWNYGTI